MKEVLKKIYPQSTEANCGKYAEYIEEAMQRYNINNVNRMRAFLSQIGVESLQLASVSEGLTYKSIDRLIAIFGKYFKDKNEAASFLNNPIALGNRVYANRGGNGSEDSGDGYKYRGRGLIQLTGKDNYSRASLGIGSDLINNPDLLVTPKHAALASAWFWDSNGLNSIADRLGRSDDAEVFKLICKRVNGGYNGLAERVALYNNAKKHIV